MSYPESAQFPSLAQALSIDRSTPGVRVGVVHFVCFLPRARFDFEHLARANQPQNASRLQGFLASSLKTSPSTAVMSVSMKPGATALTVTPRPANSSAALRVKPITPALEAE